MTASVSEDDTRLAIALRSCRPTSTKSAPLSRNVVTVQNARDRWRVSAAMSSGPSWLMASPQTTTASTPDAWISSATRNAVNGVSTPTVFSSSESCRYRRARPDSHATASPASTPPT